MTRSEVLDALRTTDDPIEKAFIVLRSIGDAMKQDDCGDEIDGVD